jgi:hypothetical protein
MSVNGAAEEANRSKLKEETGLQREVLPSLPIRSPASATVPLASAATSHAAWRRQNRPIFIEAMNKNRCHWWPQR